MTLPDADAAGAADALARAYLTLRPTLLRIFAARLRSAEAAEDLIQELYLTVRRAPSPQAVADPKAWLFKAASNLLIDRQRGRARSERRDGAWLNEGETEPEPSRQAETSPERRVAGKQVLMRALLVIDAMPERMGQAFRLTRIEGLTQAQAAARMGVSSKAIEKHVAAALQRLTAEMKGLWP